nr:hypothetical protein [Bacillus sp. FJAT-50079]
MGLSLLKPGVAASSQFELINWISLPIFIVAGLVGLGFIYLGKSKILHSLLFAISALGCSIATSHGIFGIIYRVLQITGVIGLESRSFNIRDDMYVVWDLVIFEPWFLIEGILLAVAGWCSLKGGRSRMVFFERGTEQEGLACGVYIWRHSWVGHRDDGCAICIVHMLQISSEIVIIEGNTVICLLSS